MNSPHAMSFACLQCCKSFKRNIQDIQNIPSKLPCPQCGGNSYNFGRHFKAPKQTDAKQWQKVKYLFEHGFHFQKIRTGPKNHDTVPYPETLEEAKEFVVKYKHLAINGN